MTDPTVPPLSGTQKAWAGFIISLVLSVLTAVTQVLTDGTVKTVLLIVGVALTSIGTGLGVYQTVNRSKV